MKPRNKFNGWGVYLEYSLNLQTPTELHGCLQVLNTTKSAINEIIITGERLNNSAANLKIVWMDLCGILLCFKHQSQFHYI